MWNELHYTALNQPLMRRKEVPLPYRPPNWRDWQMNFSAQSGVLVAIQSIGRMKNHRASVGYEILDGLFYPPLWSAQLNRRKSHGVFQEKEGFRERRGWQAWDSLVRASKSRDITRVAVCCLFLVHVEVQQGCGSSSQHSVLHEALLEWYSF